MSPDYMSRDLAGAAYLAGQAAIAAGEDIDFPDYDPEPRQRRCICSFATDPDCPACAGDEP